MNFRYTINPERRIILQRYAGRISLADSFLCIRQILADPAYDKSYSGYIDLTDAVPEIAYGDVNTLVDFLRHHPATSEGRCAAVTNSPLITACGMLYQKAMAHHHAFAVFSTPEGARAFLQLEDSFPHWEARSYEEVAV